MFKQRSGVLWGQWAPLPLRLVGRLGQQQLALEAMQLGLVATVVGPGNSQSFVP